MLEFVFVRFIWPADAILSIRLLTPGFLDMDGEDDRYGDEGVPKSGECPG